MLEGYPPSKEQPDSFKWGRGSKHTPLFTSRLFLLLMYADDVHDDDDDLENDLENDLMDEDDDEMPGLIPIDNDDFMDEMIQMQDHDNDVVFLNEDLIEVEVAEYHCAFPDCTDVFTSEFWLVNHYRIHMGGFPKCPYCMRTFWKEHARIAHIELHRRQNNWMRRRALVLSLYGWSGFHHEVNQPLTAKKQNLVASIFGNRDLVQFLILPFL